MFARAGFAGTTVDSIAVAAHVSRSTVFNHFPHKQDLLTEWASQCGHRMKNVVTIRRSVMCTVEDALRDYTAELARLCVDQSETATAVISAMEHPARSLAWSWIRPDITEIVSHSRHPGALTHSTAEQLSLLLSTAYAATLVRWATEPDDLNLETALRANVQLLIRGLLPTSPSIPTWTSSSSAGSSVGHLAPTRGAGTQALRVVDGLVDELGDMVVDQ
ncbi:hypothetical protein ASE24_19415 [Nocardioides sp. Root224]|nr:hypothetical protein ASE24_19415 [Nocardioides sp. Root224]